MSVPPAELLLHLHLHLHLHLCSFVPRLCPIPGVSKATMGRPWCSSPWAGGGWRSIKLCHQHHLLHLGHALILEKFLNPPILLGLDCGHSLNCCFPGKSLWGLIFPCASFHFPVPFHLIWQLDLSWSKLGATPDCFCWESSAHQKSLNSQLVCLPKALKLVR